MTAGCDPGHNRFFEVITATAVKEGAIATGQCPLWISVKIIHRALGTSRVAKEDSPLRVGAQRVLVVDDGYRDIQVCVVELSLPDQRDENVLRGTRVPPVTSLGAGYRY